MDEKQMKAIIEEKLQKVFTDGLKQGTKAVIGVVLEEITTEDKSAEEKLNTLKLFCERSLRLEGAE